MKPIWIFVPGVLNWPGDSKGWERAGCPWMLLNADTPGFDNSYFTTPATVWIHRKRRAEALADLLNDFNGKREINIAAHSNGTEVVCDALKLASSVRVNAVHLVAGAVSADFYENGLNQALGDFRVQTVTCYRGGKDLAMRLENFKLGKILFGLRGGRPLGLAGPMKVDLNFIKIGHARWRVREFVEPSYGHSTWFSDANFDATMRRFIP